jgi:hypothetical protein
MDEVHGEAQLRLDDSAFGRISPVVLKVASVGMDGHRSSRGENGTRKALGKKRKVSMGENNATFSRMVCGAWEGTPATDGTAETPCEVLMEACGAPASRIQVCFEMRGAPASRPKVFFKSLLTLASKAQVYFDVCSPRASSDGVLFEAGLRPADRAKVFSKSPGAPASRIHVFFKSR